MVVRKQKSFFLSFLLIFVLLGGILGTSVVQRAHAATLTVTNTNDSGGGSLRQAILDAVPGDRITFNSTLAGQTITLGSTLVIDKDLTIDASSLSIRITLSGGNQYRILQSVSPVQVTINNLQFSNAAASGIYNTGNLTIKSSVFSGNTSSNGAAIYNEGSLNLSDSLFSRNSAANQGGAIFNFANATLTITNSTFQQNSASDGGAIITTLGSQTTITGSSFTNNTASSTGGSIFLFPGTVNIINSTFAGNSSTYGGAIGIHSSGTLTVTNSQFTNNSATQAGGAISNGGNLTLTSNTFSGNTAGISGGGIYNSFSTTSLENVIFTGNSSGSGSAMFNSNSSPSLLNVTFSNNFGSSGSRGGAMVNDLNSNPSLVNVTFSGNSVNLLGGAMMNSDNSNPMLENVTFVDNSTSDRGGAIYNWSSNPSLKNVTFSGNSANTGGAIYNDNNSIANIVNTILYGDTGGEIYNNSSTATVTYSIVQGGYAGTGNLSTNPNLGPLQDNGGSTQTMALPSGSPAIDAGNDATCSATDQRDVMRPQGAHCDIGAFEYVPPYISQPFYLSLASSQTIGGVSAADEDILKFNGTNWSLFFDGSDVGVGSPDLFAFSIVDPNTILMAFNANVTLNGIPVTPQDVVRFRATSLGSTTAGTFDLYFDGGDAGFDDTTNEKIDSLSLLPDGRLLISTTGNPIVPGVSGVRDEDVLAFTPASLGDVTSGTWSMYFDGSDVGLADTSGEDIDALDVVGSNIYLSTQDNFSVNGVSGADEDVFVCAASSIGDVTACNYSPNLYFDGSTWGLSANDVDAFNFLASGAAPTPTPTPTDVATSTPTPINTSTFTPTSGSSSVVTFMASADARVNESSPTTNYGTATTLQADGGSGTAQNSYIRFTVGDLNGQLWNAKLRVFCTTNGTSNGPALYLADSNWIESGTGGINWNNKPALLSGVIDNKGAIATSTWVEYDVTTLVMANDTFTFALVADGTDGVTFSSHEGTAAPQLVITLDTGSPTATTQTPTGTPGATGTPTSTSTPTATPTSTPTSTVGSTPTPTNTPAASAFSFTPIADSYVDANNPTVNYGTSTALRVDASPVVRSYLRFNIQGLSGNVSRITLRIFANSASSSGVAASAVSDNTWTETTINSNNAPPIGNVLGSSGAVGAGTWITIDITAYVIGDGMYNLALTTPGSTAISLASRESGANSPQLIIETTP